MSHGCRAWSQQYAVGCGTPIHPAFTNHGSDGVRVREHVTASAEQAVPELSLLRCKPCDCWRGFRPVHDQHSHCGQWKLLVWALHSCWWTLTVPCVSMLACGVANVRYARLYVLTVQWCVNTVLCRCWSVRDMPEHMRKSCSRV